MPDQSPSAAAGPPTREPPLPVPFSVQCPSCFRWTAFTPAEYTRALISSEAEWRDLAIKIKASALADYGNKLLTCGDAGVGCPAPFSLCIFLESSLAHEAVATVPSFIQPHAFRLYRPDRHSRYEDHFAVLFHFRSIERLNLLLLDSLIDRELLRDTVNGMTTELVAPITLYAAKPHPTGKPEWIPIEAQSDRNAHVPPRYNAFCSLCRTISINRCMELFRSRYPRAGSGPDVMHLPKFIDIRSRECPCYISDVSLLTELSEHWKDDTLPLGYFTRPCWAGFHEIVAPIVVHDQLVGALVTGQFVTTTTKLTPFDEIQRSLSVPSEHLEDLRHLYGNGT